MARHFPLTVATALLLSATTALADAPPFVPIQGFLTDSSGLAIDGMVTLDLTLYGDTNDVLHTETQSVDVDEGAFSTLIGETTVLDLGLFSDHTTLSLGISVDGGAELTPRVDVATVPFAAHAQSAVFAQNAASIDGLLPEDLALAGNIPWTDIQDVPGYISDGDDDTLASLRCLSGQIPVLNNGTWACGAAQSGGYTIGDGLMESRGTLSVDNAHLDARYVNHNEAGSITGTMIATDSVDGTHLADGSVALSELDQPSVDTRYRSVFAHNSGSNGSTVLSERGSCFNFEDQAVTITVPGPGKVFVQATTHIKVRHVQGTEDLIAVSIGSTPTDCGNAQSRSLFEMPANYPSTPTPTSGNPLPHVDASLNPMRVFDVPSAGTYTFYVNGIMVYGSEEENSALLWFNQTFATYFPE